MKKIKYILVLAVMVLFNACYDLDLNPLSKPTTENWYSNETEIEMAIKDLYKNNFWPMASEAWTDDYTYRENPHAMLLSQLSGQSSDVISLWENMYKAIGRANTILNNMNKAASLGIPEAKINRYIAEASFIRASMYANLVFRFGDVVWVDKTVSIEEAFKIGRTSKDEIIPKIYTDFDKAADFLPISYGGSSKHATKGAALALKARFALYMGDYVVAESACKACIDLGVYQLNDNFEELFLTTTKDAKESIFVIPRSIEFDSSFDVTYILPRNVGGYAANDPSWALLASFLCKDGLPIDESPLFDSHDPFKNRDPRCTATIAPFGKEFLGFDYNPHPEALEVMNYNTGKMQKNNDTRANAQYASFNALVWKKGVDEMWLENGKKVDPDNIIIRYADVLLMYAESKIEQSKIDQSLLDAINMVRSRAYGVDKTQTAKYPEVVDNEKVRLRKILRAERRMEFANEGLRYNDLIRWRLADEAINTKDYAPLYPASLCIEKVTSKGHWFWSHTPQISENGVPSFEELEQAGTVMVLSERSWDDRQYLWPIPTKEILINTNLVQNSGY